MGFQNNSCKFETSKHCINDDNFTEPSINESSYKKDERTNSVSERFTTVLESIRLFFTSVTVKPRSSSNSMSYTTQTSCDTSSGYQSLDNSLDLDDSYIKVSKFTDKEENGEMGHYGTYKEYKEMAQQQQLATQIKEIIESNNNIIGSIKISDYLTLRTSGDVMNLSKCEPYGLKGCKLILIIEENGATVHLGNIFPEKGIVCTFEITLVLHTKKNPCRRIPFFSCKQNELLILEQYELRKEKMYTSKKRKSPMLQS